MNPANTWPCGLLAAAAVLLAAGAGSAGQDAGGTRPARTAAPAPAAPDTPQPIAVEPRLPTPTLFLIGDSTVRNGKGDGANGQWGWGEPLAAYFDPGRIRIVNRAIGGRSSRTFRSEGRWDQILSELRPGDFVLIQFGHNDGSELFVGNRPRGSLKGTGDETAEGTVEMSGAREVVHSFGWYLRQYVRETKAKGAVPIICSPVPRKIWTPEERVARASADYGGWAAAVAREESAAFVDLNEIVARRYDALGPQQVEALFADEHTHTNDAGARLNAECVVAGLKGLATCPLRAHLSPAAAAVKAEPAAR